MQNLDDIKRAGGICPYQVKDGKWGGWAGPRQWFRAEQFGIARKDVIECTDEKPRQWVRLWVNAEMRWRQLTDAEIVALPEVESLSRTANLPACSNAKLSGGQRQAARSYDYHRRSAACCWASARTLG